MKLVRSDRLKTIIDVVTRGTLRFEQMRKLPLSELLTTYKVQDGDTPVTIMDIQIGDLMTAEFAQLWPELQVYDEEKPLSAYNPNRPIGYQDPVDGTSNATRGLYCSVQSVAVMQGGEVVLCAVGNAFDQTIMFAEKGSGAWVQPLLGGDATRLRVSEQGRKFNERVAFVDSLSNRKNRDRKLGFRSMLARDEWSAGCMTTREYASHIYMWCMLAAGKAEMFLADCIGFHGDTAPGILLVSEAGGMVTNINGGLPQPERHYLALGTNGEYHQEILAILRTCYQGYEGFR